MDRLWAPWRLEYVTAEEKDSHDGCLFCVKYAEDDDAKNYVVKRGKTCFCLLNIYPYNNGHLMVAPLRHVADLSDLNMEERSEMMELAVEMKELLQKKINPHGFNIGINCGAIAGAGITDHLHLHIVPRWSGDTNFMPVINDTRVIPQSLDALYEILINEGSAD